MEAKAKLFGHPIHQMLIVFPLGLLATAVLFDIVWLVRDRPGWAAASYHMIFAGIVFGLVAAVPGFVDWLGIPSGTRAKRIGLLHAVGNVVVLALFAGSFWQRYVGDPLVPSTAAIAMGVAGAALSLVTGWLGGELVDRLAVGVDEGAHVDAPSSLSGRAASGAPRGTRNA
ncbi:MAG TPA: DUF2231 domain-containing protein [Gemmatimonadaceae bacterium]